ncbi:MAG TPA: YhbY family RNA-binding protein [Clostridiaceae bacterium]
MITSKQRSYLRSLSSTLKPIFHLGKAGIDDNFIKQIDEALEARELIKISILDSSEYTPRELSDLLFERLKTEGVLTIGKRLVIYRRSENKPKIELPL